MRLDGDVDDQIVTTFPDPGFMAYSSLNSGRMCMTVRLRFLRYRDRREFGVALGRADTREILKERHKLIGSWTSLLTRELKRQKVISRVARVCL